VNTTIPPNIQSSVFEVLAEASVSEKHATLVARVCEEEVQRKPEILQWCGSPDDDPVDFGKLVVAVYLEDDLASRADLNSPHVSELRTATYGVYDRWR
jgi:hypothetical protein